MKRIYLRKIAKFIEYGKVSSPKVKLDNERLIINSKAFSIEKIVLLTLITPGILMIIENIILGLIYALVLIYAYTTLFEAAKTFEIDFINKQSTLKSKNPFRFLLFFLYKDIVFPISEIAGFRFESNNASKGFMIRYNYYVILKNGKQYIFAESKHRQEAKVIVDLLNKATW
ncbi:hypothetical protein DVR12_26745 [Chitinophaga silvatica]|uniref:Uncharacterized protein n=1 Tax=Chitinophaga silvatica TaxID=2282649 RepID=A0A3E1Y285_9BACT|nr:hypothetical protein [Chitinophaga silvatica]RFS18800.1 hypothetical protein DVR12_26745 [Chitinophaga silvatica]